MPSGTNASRFSASLIAHQTPSFKIGGADSGSSNLKGFESLLHRSSYSSLVYCNQRSLKSLFSRSNVPFCLLSNMFCRNTVSFLKCLQFVCMLPQHWPLFCLQSHHIFVWDIHHMLRCISFSLVSQNLGDLFFLLLFYVRQAGFLFHVLSILCVAF